MSDRIAVFVNERRVEVSSDSSVNDAVTAHDHGLGDALAAGSAYVTDGVGCRRDPASPVSVGDILRVVKTEVRSSTN